MRNQSKFNVRLSAIALGVLGLFVTTASKADDEEIKALTQPKSSVQVEVIGVDQNSAKFGEYNGLYGHPSGAYPNGALNIRGGGAYTNNEQGDTTRWSVTGQDLGLTSRSANASISDQGSWGVGVNFDQLQHNISNSYQTPYQGTMGGNKFILPSNLKGNAAITTTASPALQGDLSSMGISTTRYNTTLNGTAIVDKNFNITFEYNNLSQTGAKLQSFLGTQAPNGNNNPGNGSMSSLLPVPTNYQTDTINLAANWKGENSHLTASYFGSFFQNTNQAMQWEVMNKTLLTTQGINPNPLQTSSLAPSNAFNQLNLAGGYDFTTKTKLTGNLSIGQNTQNQGFGGTYDPGMMYSSSPSASMNGIVNTTHADLKVTDRSAKDLVLTAGAKYDVRDNLSQSNLYQSYNPTTGIGSTPNTPLSFKQTQLSLGGDYRIDKDQKLGVTIANNAVQRWCNQYGTTAPNTAASPYNTLYYNSTNCASATSSSENKLDALYKIKASEEVNIKVGAGYANRKTQWDANAFIAMPKLGFANDGSYAGFQPFFEASRKQAYGKASADWQALEDLTLTLGGKYTADTYPDSSLGVQNGYSWSLNFDSTYAYDEKGAASFYVTQQNMQRNYADGTSPSPSATQPSITVANPTLTYANNLNTNSTTLGFGIRQAGLVNGKVGVSADATYSRANSIYNTSGAACSPPNAANTACGSLPGIQNNLGIIKLGASYQLDKNSKFGMMYWYQHLYSNDFYYNATGYGANNASGITPTNQTSPSYSVNVIMANYTYTFD